VPRPPGIEQATTALFTDDNDEHVLAVGTGAKCMTSRKRISKRPEGAVYIASSLKQRWQFLVYPARSEDCSGSELNSPIGNEEGGEADIDAPDGVGPEEVPGEEEDDELEHEDGEQDGEPAADSVCPPPSSQWVGTYASVGGAWNVDPVRRFRLRYVQWP
jgi:hypothetical protein